MTNSGARNHHSVMISGPRNLHFGKISGPRKSKKKGNYDNRDLNFGMIESFVFTVVLGRI